MISQSRSQSSASPLNRNTPQKSYVCALCALCAVLTMVIASGIGSSGVSWLALLAPENDEAATILLDIRLPRVLVAALCGAMLAVAGVASQGLFRNGLATPSILGTTTGGSFGAALCFYFGLVSWHWWLLPVGAFAGCFVATALVLALASRFSNWSTGTLLIAGFALNSLFGAATSAVISLMLEEHHRAAGAMHWLLGGFSGKGWEHVYVLLIPFAAGTIFLGRQAARLDVLSLGEDVASTLNVDPKTLRRVIIVGISVLVGSAVSFAGAIPFVGLLVPHISRQLVGPQHRRLMVASLFNGVTLMVAADLAARTLRAPSEFEVGVLTSLLGAPFFLYLLIKNEPRGGTWA